MNGMRGWAAAALAVAVLNAAPGEAQALGCDGGRGGIMPDLGFDRLRRSMRTDPQSGRMELVFDAEPSISGVRADGPAAGRLRDGDVLMAVDGHPVTTREGARRFAEIDPGEEVRLSLRRGGGVQDVTLTAQGRCIPTPPAPPEAPAPPLPPMDELLPEGWLGFAITCQNCGDDASGAFRFSEPLVVVSVEPRSPAGRAGLRAGDRLTHVQGVPLTSEAGWPQWSAIRPGQAVRLTYTRGGRAHTVTIPALRRPDGDPPR